MTNRNKLNSFLADFGAAMNLGAFEFDESDYAGLGLDDQVFHLHAHGESISVQTIIGVLQPGRDYTELFALLLKANFQQLGTAGATIGLNEDGSTVVLYREIVVAAMSSPDFGGAMETFIEIAFALRGIIVEAQNSSDENETSSAAQVDGGTDQMLRI